MLQPIERQALHQSPTTEENTKLSTVRTQRASGNMLPLAKPVFGGTWRGNRDRNEAVKEETVQSKVEIWLLQRRAEVVKDGV